MPIEFKVEIGGEDEELEDFLEVYDTIKDNLEKILERYPITRTKGFGTIATIFLYYWHYHPEQLIRLCKAIYYLVRKKRKVRVEVCEDGNGNKVRKIIPMTLNDRELEIFLNAIRGLTNPEDILRNKRRIQNDEGKFRPPAEDEEEARRKEEVIKKAMARRY